MKNEIITKKQGKKRGKGKRRKKNGRKLRMFKGDVVSTTGYYHTTFCET